MTTSDAFAAMGVACKTCGNSQEWHEQNVTQHKYNDGSIGTAETFGKRLADGSRTPVGGEVGEAAAQTTWPFDPVLRQALIDKGVLTPEDLRDAEIKIRAITSQFHTTGGVPA